MDRYILQLKRNNLNFKTDLEVVDCHHNYISREHHFGHDCWITRKGALCAIKGCFP